MGKALAEGFLKEGNAVCGISRSQSIKHNNYQHIQLDLSDPHQYKEFTLPQLEGFKEVVFINNAGSVEPVAKVGKLNMDNAFKSYHINVLVPIFFINLLAGASKNYKGKIYVLNISSGAAQYPVEGWGIYCSSKAALDAFAAVADKEMLNSNPNFLVRNIYPGIIDTPMQESIRGSNNEDFPEVERFKTYKEKQELSSPREVSSKIIRNFNSFFNINVVVVRL